MLLNRCLITVRLTVILFVYFNSSNINEANKIKNLLNVITGQTQSTRFSYTVLLKCENALEKLDFSSKMGAMNQTQSIQTTLINTNAKDFNACASLMETIQSNYKKPNFNHTLQRTISQAVAAITNNGYKYPAYKKSSSNECLPDEDIPHTVQGEIAKLDNKFFVELDPLQHPQSKTIHLICKIDDLDLPCVPPISIKVPVDYPSSAPRCYIDKMAYGSSKFFQDIHRIFNNNLEKLPNLYSITTLLDRWELSIREALNCERVF